ncbi:AraC family transcriptional regulator [Arachidicoccus ginsenosidivorans]|jgi:AraC-like DNA-binding protein|uniref:Helix-turn-helix domain-containing protein n=1 Tax=Arachidicoccus ginsenosidivorans TaxID=496057 RepID=A0A5B8VJ53_9BACT|nr:helix-turn-helix domain-containing protein [Arachidicoccus ginsenosidivorans]QEC71339.1 helix-turn-helix domain-containing protein [Arachidicoccus ginsenosidivorans]
MKFDKHFPTEQLRPYIKYFVVSENELENEYKVLPSSGLVIGFQYKGRLSTLKDNKESKLTTAGITGITDSYKVFKNSANIGTILVYFTETGFTHFALHPANYLFNLSLSLDYIFDKNSVIEVEEKIAIANTDKQRIKIVEQFLVSQLKDIQTDKLIVEAVKLIYQSNGTIRIKELNEKLFISQSPFEKRFRKVVGTTAKKFASIVRFNTVLNNLNESKTLTEICYENNFFDQAHFIKDFKQFTGNTPENFKRFL